MEQEYDIKTNPDSSGNPQSNETVKIIHKFLGNLICTYNLHDTYVDDAEPWMGILATAAFTVQSTYHRTKKKVRRYVDRTYKASSARIPIQGLVSYTYVSCRLKERIRFPKT